MVSANHSLRPWKNTLSSEDTTLSFVTEVAPGSTSDSITLSVLSKSRLVSELAKETFYILEPETPSPQVQKVSETIVAELASRKIESRVLPWTTELSELKGKPLVSLVELENSIWTKFSPREFDHLKALTLQSARLLWVSMGENTELQVALGYLRVLQSENPHLDLRFLNLEQTTELQSTANVIAKLAAVSTSDREYIETDGVLCINRWATSKDLRGLLATSNDAEGREYVKLSEAPGALNLVSHESSKSIYFEIDDNLNNNLSPDEVEIEVKAIALKYDRLPPFTSIETNLFTVIMMEQTQSRMEMV